MTEHHTSSWLLTVDISDRICAKKCEKKQKQNICLEVKNYGKLSKFMKKEKKNGSAMIMLCVKQSGPKTTLLLSKKDFH